MSHECPRNNSESQSISSVISEVPETNQERSKTKDQLVGLACVTAGAAVLYFFSANTIGLSGGVSCLTLGLMMVSGKLPKKE